MTEPPELDDLLDVDLPDDELDRLRRADGVLRSVPAPPAGLPASLEARLEAIPLSTSRRVARRRLLGALALAATLVAGVFFGGGYLVGSDGFDPVRTVTMEPTEEAPRALARIGLGAKDADSGNWQLALDVEGLPQLPEGGYYVLWLTKDGELAVTCGTFNVGPGTTSVRMTASYPLSEFDEWVISEDADDSDEEPPWLLRAPATAPQTDA